MDADNRAGMAGLGTDPQRVAARTHGRAAILARDGVLTRWRRAG